MNRSKIIIITLTMILLLSLSGCGGKTGASFEGDADANQSDINSSTAAVQQDESERTDDVGSPGNEENQASAEGSSASQSIAVVSKSDSTITQAEKKKVLDELSAEVDSLIIEVNKSDATESTDLN